MAAALESTPAAESPTSKLKYKNIVTNYTQHFGVDDNQTKVTNTERTHRQGRAAQLTDDYYNFATSAYINGWSTHFHYTPFAPNDSIEQSMTFYEHKFAHLMNLKPGMKVLDVGCGVGGPAREIAKFIGCEIVGITINQQQVDRAIEMTAQAGLSHLCTFLRGDFLNLTQRFLPGSFDAAYAVEATVHAPSLKHVYSEISKVLKPGASFGLSEWVLTPSYDPENTKHLGIRNRIERGNSISNLDTSDNCRKALQNSGFRIYHDEDFALHWKKRLTVTDPVVLSPVTVRGKEPPGLAPLPRLPGRIVPPVFRPWYYPLAGMASLAQTKEDYRTAYRMSKWPRQRNYAWIWMLEHLHLCPQGILAAIRTMAYCVDSVVEGGQEGVFTPCWWFICEKVGEPAKESAANGVNGLPTSVR